MSRPKVNRYNLSDGERSVLLAYFAISILGAGLSFSVVNNLGGAASVLRPLSTYDLWTIFAGTVGAPVGLFAGRSWFGHPGVGGIVRAIAGMPVVILFAGIVGGTLALPFYGTMFGPFSIVMLFLSFPLLSLFFATTMLAMHRLFAIYRRERETLFRMPPDDGLPI